MIFKMFVIFYIDGGGVFLNNVIENIKNNWNNFKDYRNQNIANLVRTCCRVLSNIHKYNTVHI